MQELTKDVLFSNASSTLAEHNLRHEAVVEGEILGPAASDEEDGESSEYEMVEESGEEEMEEPL